MRRCPALAVGAVRFRVSIRAAITCVPILTYVGVPACVSAQDASPAEIGDLRSSVERLELEDQLAEGGGFYLVLDAGAGTLGLFFEGIPLRTYPVSDVAIGRPYRLFVSNPDEPRVTGRIWGNARLEPKRIIERVEIVSDQVVPPDPTGAISWVPPTPEEQYPIRPRYRVLYEGGLSLEIVADDSPAAESADANGDAKGDANGEAEDSESTIQRPGVVSRLLGWLGERLSLLFSGGDRVRVRLVLPASEAGRLYRSLPEESPLLIVTPVPGPVARDAADG